MNQTKSTTRRINFKGKDIAENLYSNQEAEKSGKLDIPSKSDLFILEYSSSQKCFHIEELEEMLLDNLDSFLSGRLADYVPLAISGDRAVLEQILETLNKADN